MIRTGLEVLLAEQRPPTGPPLRSLLAGRRLGLVAHAASVLPDLTGSLDALLLAGLRVRALFGMEHGFTSAAAEGAEVQDAVDPHSGLPVYSLYGATREPTAEMLEGLDVLVYDVQDVGARFYTYVTTLYHVLRAGGRYGRPVVVLDRPNPIGGLAVEGPLLDPSQASFVGMPGLPVRYGLTLGELAGYLNRTFGLGAALTVVPMQGWSRRLWFDQTGLPWVAPSPNMPHPQTAILYPGTCLWEGTNLSVGRGTTLPFETLGAPWIDPYRWASTLQALDLPGAGFRPTTFRPAAGKLAGEACGGVQVHVLDREHFSPVRTALHMLAALRSLYPHQFAFEPAHFDRLMGRSHEREQIMAGRPVDEVIADWGAGQAAFRAAASAHRLYP